MKYYYRLKVDNTILDFTSFEADTNVPSFIKELYTETDRKIIKLVDGSFAFEDEIDIDEEARKRAEKEFVEAKQNKLTEFKSTRDNLEVEPITYNGNSFDYDEKARDRINAAIIALDLAGADAQLSWTTADNTEAIVTANDLRGIIANVALRSNELHVHYRELKALVEATTTKEELEAIVW